MNRLTPKDFFHISPPKILHELSSNILWATVTDYIIYLVNAATPCLLHKYSINDLQLIGSIQIKQQPIKCVCMFRDFTCVVYKYCQLLQISLGNHHQMIQSHLQAINCLQTINNSQDHDSILATGSDDMTVRLWKIEDGEVTHDSLQHVLVGHQGSVGFIEHVQHQFVSAGQDKCVIFWCKRKQFARKIFPDEIIGLKSCPQSNQLAVCFPSKVSIIEVKSVFSTHNVTICRQIKMQQSSNKQLMQQIDDSFLLHVSDDKLNFLQINLGSLINTVSFGKDFQVSECRIIGRLIIAVDCYKRISLIKL